MKRRNNKKILQYLITLFSSKIIQRLTVITNLRDFIICFDFLSTGGLLLLLLYLKTSSHIQIF